MEALTSVAGSETDPENGEVSEAMYLQHMHETLNTFWKNQQQGMEAMEISTGNDTA